VGKELRALRTAIRVISETQRQSSRYKVVTFEAGIYSLQSPEALYDQTRTGQ
jgi:hypothetical protein